MIQSVQHFLIQIYLNLSNRVLQGPKIGGGGYGYRESGFRFPIKGSPCPLRDLMFLHIDKGGLVTIECLTC